MANATDRPPIPDHALVRGHVRVVGWCLNTFAVVAFLFGLYTVAIPGPPLVGGLLPVGCFWLAVWVGWISYLAYALDRRACGVARALVVPVLSVALILVSCTGIPLQVSLRLHEEALENLIEEARATPTGVLALPGGRQVGLYRVARVVCTPDNDRIVLTACVMSPDDEIGFVRLRRGPIGRADTSGHLFGDWHWFVWVD